MQNFISGIICQEKHDIRESNLPTSVSVREHFNIYNDILGRNEFRS